MKDNEKNVNVCIDKDLWKKVGALAAEMELAKKDFLHHALQNFILEINRSTK